MDEILEYGYNYYLLLIYVSRWQHVAVVVTRAAHPSMCDKIKKKSRYWVTSYYVLLDYVYC